jgi:hypothetical protein
MQFAPQDWQQMALTAGLSMLGNNDGTRSVGQLIGQGGLDALAGLQFRKQYEAQMARQKMLDERAQAQHDMQMQKGQFELDEARRRAELMKLWQAGDMEAYKILFPEQWAQDQRQAQAHRNALALEALKQKKDVGKYVDGVGMVSPSGVVTPLTDASGAPYQTPKQRKEQAEATKLEDTQRKQKDLALQTAKTQLTSLNNALELTKDGRSWRNTGIIGSTLSLLPGTDARNLEAELDTIGAGSMIQTMMQLKAASPTGATGMGALNKEEGQALRDSLGSLDTWQDPAQLRRNLENIKTVYTNMLLGWGYTPEEVESMFGGSGNTKGDISRFDK